MLAVVDAEVVGAGFEINMCAQEIAATVQAEDGRGGLDERWQCVAGGEATFVVSVVGEQRGTVGEHGGEVGVVGVKGEVVGGLLRIAEVLAVASACFETGIAGDGIGERDAFIERADKNRLPTAARKAGHRHAFGVGIGMGEQHIEALAHVQIKRRDAGRAAEVELVHLIMPHPIGELTHANPLWVEHNHPAFHKIDAAELFVIRRLARTRVTVDVHHHGHIALEVERLVKERGNPPAGYGLEFQFLDAVAGEIFDGLAPFDLERRVAPLCRAAAKDDFVQNIFAVFGGFGFPFGGGADAGHFGHAAFVEDAHLFQRKIRADNFFTERLADVGLGERIRVGDGGWLRQQERRAAAGGNAQFAQRLGGFGLQRRGVFGLSGFPAPTAQRGHGCDSENKCCLHTVGLALNLPRAVCLDEKKL